MKKKTNSIQPETESIDVPTVSSAKDENEAFKKLLAKIKPLSCLAHNNDQADEVLCDILWKAIEEESRTLHAQTKNGIEFVFERTVEGISNAIHKYMIYKKKNRNEDPILFEENAEQQNANPSHSHQSSDEQIDSHHVLLNNQ